MACSLVGFAILGGGIYFMDVYNQREDSTTSVNFILAVVCFSLFPFCAILCPILLTGKFCAECCETSCWDAFERRNADNLKNNGFTSTGSGYTTSSAAASHTLPILNLAMQRGPPAYRGLPTGPAESDEDEEV